MITVLLLIILLFMFYYFIYSDNNIKEHAANVAPITNDEAIQNIASLYNTAQMQLTNLNVTQTLTATTSNLMPKGGIIMWSGSAVPATWALCNGSNGTPNLQNRFILGSSTNDINKTGGSADQRLSVDQIPSHSHTITSLKQGGSCSANCPRGSDLNFMVNQSTDTRQSAAAGGGAAFSIMPPYYTLAFIMKL
jgi:microcystin-dependent protein